MAKDPIIWMCIRKWWIASGALDDPAYIGAITDYTPPVPPARIHRRHGAGAIDASARRPGPPRRQPRLPHARRRRRASLFLASLGKHCPWFIAASGGLTPLFAILIWTLTVDDSFLARLLAWSPLVFLGEASYAVYILHEPIDHWAGVLVTWITHRPVTRIMFDIPNYWVLILYIALVLSLCGLIYRYFELPARDRIRRGFSRRSNPQPQPAAATASYANSPLQLPREISHPVSP